MNMVEKRYRACGISVDNDVMLPVDIVQMQRGLTRGHQSPIDAVGKSKTFGKAIGRNG